MNFTINRGAHNTILAISTFHSDKKLEAHLNHCCLVKLNKMHREGYLWRESLTLALGLLGGQRAIPAYLLYGKYPRFVQKVGLFVAKCIFEKLLKGSEKSVSVVTKAQIMLVVQLPVGKVTFCWPTNGGTSLLSHAPFGWPRVIILHLVMQW